MVVTIVRSNMARASSALQSAKDASKFLDEHHIEHVVKHGYCVSDVKRYASLTQQDYMKFLDNPDLIPSIFIYEDGTSKFCTRADEHELRVFIPRSIRKEVMRQAICYGKTVY